MSEGPSPLALRMHQWVKDLASLALRIHQWVRDLALALALLY